MLTSLALFGPIGTWEAIVLLGLGLLIFGRRLPEVGKNVGRTIVEFKKGLSGAYSGEGEEKPQEPEEPASSQRRLQSPPPRVAVNQNLEDQPKRVTARKSLPQTEEV